MGGDLGWWGVLVAVLGGAIRLSTPYLFVGLGETLTEKSGRVNLGLEGTLVMGAMSGYAVSFLTGSPWLGVLVAGGAGARLLRGARAHADDDGGRLSRRRGRIFPVAVLPRDVE